MILKLQGIKKEHLYGGIIFGLAVLILFFFFKISLPNLKLGQGLLSKTALRAKELKARKETLAQVDKLKEELRLIEEDYESFTQKFFLQPQDMNAVKVITELTTGLKIEFISLQPLALVKLDMSSHKEAGFLKFFQKEKMDFFIWEMPVMIKLKADYASLLKLVRRLEESARFIRIKSFQIKKEPASPLTHMLEFTLSMFSLPQLTQKEGKR